MDRGGAALGARHSPTASTLPADPSVRNKTVALRMLDPFCVNVNGCQLLVLPECQLRVVAAVCGSRAAVLRSVRWSLPDPSRVCALHECAHQSARRAWCSCSASRRHAAVEKADQLDEAAVA